MSEYDLTLEAFAVRTKQIEYLKRLAIGQHLKRIELTRAISTNERLPPVDRETFETRLNEALKAIEAIHANE